VNSDNSPKRKEQQSPLLRRSLIGAIILLALTAYLLPMFVQRAAVQDVSLPAIATAIEAGEIEKVTVQGDSVIATKAGGTQLSALKESNISLFEALQVLGVPPETLKTVPIVVENPGPGAGTIFSLLLTFGPFLLIGYIIFRVMRQVQSGDGPLGLPGRIGRSSPRVMSKTAAKDEKLELPTVTFDDVAGAEQAKLELQEVVEALKEPEKFIKLGARTPKGVLNYIHRG